MRKQIAEPMDAAAGDVLTFSAALRKGQTSAYIQVFSAVGPYTPSPHIEAFKLDVNDGKPSMLTSPTLRLDIDADRKQTIRVTADEKAVFYLFQEVDTPDTTTARARIANNGHSYRTKIIQTFRWARREWRRFIRRHHDMQLQRRS